MEQLKTVIYIGNFSFPLGNAAGKRVYANGKILRKLGYHVIFIGMSDQVAFHTELSETEARYDEFTYYNFPYPKGNLDWFKYPIIYKKFKQLIRKKKLLKNLDMIIYYGSPTLSIFNYKLINYAHRHQINVISDCVDWLSNRTSNPVYNIVKWLDNTYQKRYANKKTDGVIAISHYLSKFYKNAGCKAVIIPPLAPDRREKCSNLDIQERTIVSYAGIPFRKGIKIQKPEELKDRIDQTIKMFVEAKREGSLFIFNIYGFTKEEYLFAFDSHQIYIEELGESICFYGMKPSYEVMQAISESHFTILLRDVTRGNTAGFPTKVSESISCGTPVITTRTSDLELYIKNSENGFFIENAGGKESIFSFVKILNMSKKKINRMKKKCLESDLFYYEHYIDKLEVFLKDLNES